MHSSPLGFTSLSMRFPDPSNWKDSTESKSGTILSVTYYTNIIVCEKPNNFSLTQRTYQGSERKFLPACSKQFVATKYTCRAAFYPSIFEPPKI